MGLARSNGKGFILGRRVIPDKQPLGFTSALASPDVGSQIIRFAGDGPILTLAPTGTGKTSGPVISNALDHPGQFICIDVKGSIHAATAERRRKMGQEVHVLDMRDGAHFEGSLNPFDIMRRLGSDVGACCWAFAGNMVGDGTVHHRDRFWSDWAETMITGGLAYLWHHKPVEERSLGALFDLYHEENLTHSIAAKLDNTKPMNKVTDAAWSGFLDLSDRETQPSVLASTTVFLRLFESDMMRRLTDTTSIDLDALIAGKPISIYIIVPPYRLTAYAPILRLWVSGLLQLLTIREHKGEHRTLMMVDEAAQLGKLEALLTATTLMREYGLTLWTIFQNAAQLEVYGADARTLVDNAGVLQCFGIRNRRSATEIANLIGSITAEEIMAMKPNEQLLLIEGQTQVAQQVRYFADEMFRGMYPAVPSM